MIDDFVRQTPQLSPVEQEWRDTARFETHLTAGGHVPCMKLISPHPHRSATDKMLGTLSSAYTLSTNDLELKAKVHQSC